MLTQTQRESMIAAVTAWNHGLLFPGAAEPAEVVATRNTLADFTAAWGEPDEAFAAPEGALHVWGFDAETGAHCYYLFVMDFGEFRGAAGDAIRRDRAGAEEAGVTALGMAIYVDAIGSRDELLARRLERGIAKGNERQWKVELKRREEEAAAREAADEEFDRYLKSLDDPEEN